MNTERIQRKINKIIDELSGYVYKAEHEFQMPLDEERIAIAAACGGMAIAIGRKGSEGERRIAQRLAIGIADQIGRARSGSAHVAAPGNGLIKL